MTLDHEEKNMKSIFILLLGILLTGCVTTPADVRRQSIEKKLDTIVFPEIEFRQANIYCCLAFLMRDSKTLDPEKKGVDIVYVPSNSGHTTFAACADPFGKLGDSDKTADHSGDPGDSDGRAFTFEAHGISLREALNIICELGGFTWMIEDSVIKVRPKKVQPSVRGDGKPAPQP